MTWRAPSRGLGTDLLGRLAQSHIDEIAPSGDELLLIRDPGPEEAGGAASETRESLVRATQWRVREIATITAAERFLAAGATRCCVLALPAAGEHGVDAAVRRIRTAAPNLPLVVVDNEPAWGREAISRHLGADAYLSAGAISAEGVERAIAVAVEWRATHQAVEDTARAVGRLDDPDGEPTPAALVTIGIDDAERVAEQLASGRVDELLFTLAVRLRRVLRPADVLQRLGDDRFALLRRDPGTEYDVAALCDRLLVACRQPLPAEGDDLLVGVSIGAAMGVATDTGPLLRQSSEALALARRRGGSCYELRDAAARERVVLHRRTELGLRHALERREFRIFYQPVIGLDDRVLKAFEALLRWESPEDGLLAPATFVESAERSGLMIRIGATVLEDACRQAASAHSASGPDPVMSVNLSRLEFFQPNLHGAIAEALNKARLAPRRLSMEVPAAVLLEDPDAAMVALGALRRLGVHIVADDWDVTDDHLADRIAGLPVNAVKLALGVVAGIGTPAGERRIAATVRTARRCGWDVVGKGVETPAQLSALRELGCRAAQGFLFSAPRPLEELDARGWTGNL